MNKEVVEIKSIEDTKTLAKKISKELLEKGKKGKAQVLGLVGELGAGKTTFTQALGKELGIKKSILSPTFVISKRFPLKDRPYKNMYHIDVYRIGEKVKDVGLEDFLKEANLLVIEWADKIKDTLPKDTIWINFKHGEEESERKAVINRR